MVAAVKRFQPILTSAKTRDVNESDTMMIVTGMLWELFGYDQYSEITSEHAIRGTYCDIATLLEGQVQMLIEGKAIGIELKDSHVKQAIDYAANKGVDWVLLTNGVPCVRYSEEIQYARRTIEPKQIYRSDAMNLHFSSNDHNCLFQLSSYARVQNQRRGSGESQNPVARRSPS